MGTPEYELTDLDLYTSSVLPVYPSIFQINSTGKSSWDEKIWIRNELLYISAWNTWKWRYVIIDLWKYEMMILYIEFTWWVCTSLIIDLYTLSVLIVTLIFRVIWVKFWYEMIWTRDELLWNYTCNIKRWFIHVKWIYVVESICAWKLDCCWAQTCFDVIMKYMTNKGNEDMCRAWGRNEWICLT